MNINLQCSALKVYKEQDTGDKNVLIPGRNLGQPCLVGQAFRRLPPRPMPRLPFWSVAPQILPGGSEMSLGLHTATSSLAFLCPWDIWQGV